MNYSGTLFSFIKCSLLFIMGTLFFHMLDAIQRNKGSSLVDINAYLLGFIPPQIWLPFTCGSCSLLFGLLIPKTDNKELRGGAPDHLANDKEWSSVVRCVALFVGINQATAKLDFTSSSQFTFSLAAMSLGLWYVFDRSKNSFLLAFLGSLGLSFMSFLLMSLQQYQFHDPTTPMWLPFIFFSGIITVGLVGRQLATYTAPKDKIE